MKGKIKLEDEVAWWAYVILGGIHFVHDYGTMLMYILSSSMPWTKIIPVRYPNMATLFRDEHPITPRIPFTYSFDHPIPTHLLLTL